MKKTILITGSTDGIGKLAALKLAGQGHAVYLHGRDPEKLAAAVSEIRSTTENKNVDGFTADLSDLDAVNQMAGRIQKKLSKMDILINNAGVFNSPGDRNNKGLDMRFVVNYLAPFFLTEQLIPLLNKGAFPRIINLSSAAQAPVSCDALRGKAYVSHSEAYAQSKLALTQWSFHLAETLRDISVIAVNPGSLLNTKMAAQAYGQHWSSADKGADILCDLALSDRYQGITGKYFDNDKGGFGPAHPDAYDKTRIDALVRATRELVPSL